MIGTRGPIPKREDQRVRRNEQEIPTEKVVALGKVPVPDLGLENPHPFVVEFYESIRQSAQSNYYEPSDWQFARLTMYALNEELNAVYQSGDNKGKKKPLGVMKLQVLNQMMSTLLLTEGDRRRVRMEIERNPGPTAEGGKVLTMADHFKQVLGAQTT
ncbi:phage terminase small subunit [Mycobacteroides abscessus]|uniref:phage terminase small subunit n=1 Tax=Mycobacteroides abscessus TaxID=36809 RepID=UPI0040256572